MQDRYAFDVGDFGKIGLLRHMVAETGLTLAVLWWMTALGSPGNDGKHLGYLSDERFRPCDPWLWDAMAELVNKERSVAALEPLLPPGTRFNAAPVPALAHRRAWLNQALSNVTASARPGLLFCDPDNGVWFGPSCRSRRHVGMDEVATLWRSKHRLVLYHHLNRRSAHLNQVDQGLLRFEAELPGLAHAWGAHYRRGSSRVFFILAQPDHVDRVEGAMSTLIGTNPWVRDGHFNVRRLS
jgi:hypothetical protein